MADVLFISEFGPGSRGGVQIHLAQIIQRLNKENVDQVNVLCRYDGGCSASRSIKVLNGKLPQLYLYIFLNLRSLLDQQIIHFHDYSIAKHFIFIILMRRIIKKHTYITFHGWEGTVPPDRSVVLIKKLLNVFCDGSILIGDYLKKWYGLAGVVSYGGGDHALVQILNKEVELSVKPTDRKSKIAFVGRLEGDTGFTEVLSAFTSPKICDLELDVFGSGSLSRLVSSEKLVMYGHVNNLCALLTKYDYIITSGYLGILEGLFMGKHVIAISDNNLKSDYLQIPNLGRPFFSVVETREELINILEDVKNSRGTTTLADDEILKNNFSWQSVISCYESLWYNC
ncbi:MAG: hypothetical protein P8H57_00750 [Emcibacteraceae bacterium]|nr:hypothetical protein [Emcibacteraceae bacterium]